MKATSLEARAECGHRRSISTRLVGGSAGGFQSAVENTH